MKKTEDPFGYDDPSEDTGFLLWQVISINHLRLKKALSNNYKLLHSQYVVLAAVHWLNLRQDEITQVDISQYIKLEPMTVSQILKELQKRSYIYRKRHSTDTRAKAVFLTEDGEKVICQAIQTVRSIDAHFYRILGKGTNKFNIQLQTLVKQE